jgi:hypothetical protein
LLKKCKSKVSTGQRLASCSFTRTVVSWSLN